MQKFVFFISLSECYVSHVDYRIKHEFFFCIFVELIVLMEFEYFILWYFTTPTNETLQWIIMTTTTSANKWTPSILRIRKKTTHNKSYLHVLQFSFAILFSIFCTVTFPLSEFITFKFRNSSTIYVAGWYCFSFEILAHVEECIQIGVHGCKMIWKKRLHFRWCKKLHKEQ